MSKKSKKLLITVPLLVSLAAIAGFATHSMLSADKNLASKGPTAVTDYRELPSRDATLTKIADGLDAPWAFTWLPNGDMLVSERFGTLRIVKDGVLSEPISGVPDVFAAGQGGLLDISLHPQFAENRYVYLSYAHGTQEGNQLRVTRAELNGMTLENPENIFEVAQTKTGASHYGSRFQWLPDGTLLLSVGDGGNPPTEYDGKLIREQAQYLTAHLGKIIRINDDGTIPADNPFASRPDVRPEIWSYGHRNVQGITYDTEGERLIASEHGSKGGDELNLVLPGQNYGWPLATYSTEYDARGTLISPDQTLPDAEDPIAVWTPTIAPSDIVYYTGDRYGEWKGDLFLAAMLLRSDASIRAYMSSPAGAVLRLETDSEGNITAQERIKVGEVRVRDIDQGPDGFLYVLTDSTSRQSRAGAKSGTLWRIEPF
ncbi:MAG: PQQ-dependent sugar dehydrogenase [Cyanobacteria bacterium P01_E01_bin.42]